MGGNLQGKVTGVDTRNATTTNLAGNAEGSDSIQTLNLKLELAKAQMKLETVNLRAMTLDYHLMFQQETEKQQIAMNNGILPTLSAAAIARLVDSRLGKQRKQQEAHLAQLAQRANELHKRVIQREREQLKLWLFNKQWKDLLNMYSAIEHITVNNYDVDDKRKLRKVRCNMFDGARDVLTENVKTVNECVNVETKLSLRANENLELGIVLPQKQQELNHNVENIRDGNDENNCMAHSSGNLQYSAQQADRQEVIADISLRQTPTAETDIKIDKLTSDRADRSDHEVSSDDGHEARSCDGEHDQVKTEAKRPADDVQQFTTRASCDTDSTGKDGSDCTNSSNDFTDTTSQESNGARRVITNDGDMDDSGGTGRAENNLPLDTDEQLTETRNVVIPRQQDQRGQVTDTGQVDSGKRRRAVAISPYDGRKRKHVEPPWQTQRRVAKDFRMLSAANATYMLLLLKSQNCKHEIKSRIHSRIT